ncbi:MAG TPA: MBL fold metallo-hydrolase, partial [Steroidobacteraceae bacterium]
MGTDRRSFLKAGFGGIAGLASVSLTGALSGCQHLASQAGSPGNRVSLTTGKLADRVTLISGAPGNVVALAADDGVVLVDTGAADSAPALKTALSGTRVRTVFNTHYHADQT